MYTDWVATTTMYTCILSMTFPLIATFLFLVVDRRKALVYYFTLDWYIPLSERSFGEQFIRYMQLVRSKSAWQAMSYNEKEEFDRIVEILHT